MLREISQDTRLREQSKMNDRIKAIDFHSHILPEADHGSSGAEMTAEQLTLLKNIGVDTVVATPHFYPNYHTIDGFLEKIEESIDTVRGLDIQRPNIAIGAEVLYCTGLDRMEGLERLCIRGTDILLLELPMTAWDGELVETVVDLSQKYKLVLAHIDRYILECEDEIEYFAEQGIMAQINADALYSMSLKRKIMPYIAAGSVCAIGTDLHETDKKALKHFAAAPKKLGEAYAQIMRTSAELIEKAEII